MLLIVLLLVLVERLTVLVDLWSFVWRRTRFGFVAVVRCCEGLLFGFGGFAVFSAAHEEEGGYSECADG